MGCFLGRYNTLFLYYFQVALLYSEKYGTDKVRVLTLVKNRGKGGAVKMVSIYVIHLKDCVKHLKLFRYT